VLTPARAAALTTAQRCALVVAVELSVPSPLRSQSEDEMMDQLGVWTKHPDALDVAIDTGATPSIVLSVPPRHPAQPRELVKIQSTEQPPMAAMVGVDTTDIVWIQSSCNAANVRLLKSHRARWCSDRGCWYMLTTSSGLDVVLERVDSCDKPSRTGAGKFKKSTCTKPCYYVCPAPSPSAGGSYTRRRRQPSATTPLFLLALFTCMVPSDGAAESMFTHHMRTAPWQMRAIYGVVLLMAACKLLKRLYNDGALTAIATAFGTAGSAVAVTAAAALCTLLRCIDASAVTIGAFMDNVRKRHSPSLTAYYTATSRCLASCLQL
jgi:hypothetical protein